MKRILHGALICALLVVVSVALWPASVSAAGIAIYVDDNFVDDALNHMWDTIQEGIDDATDNAGDTVYVYEGTYAGNINVNKSYLTVQGNPNALVTINGVGLTYGIQITADDVTVRQFTIIGGNQAAVVWANAARGYLENNDISGSDGHGVLLDTITNQTVRCNDVHNNDGDGILVYNSSLKDVFKNHTYTNINGAGIRLQTSTKISVAYNESDNNDYGIYVTDDSTLNVIYTNDGVDNNFHSNNVDVYTGTGSNDWVTPGSPEPVPSCTEQAAPSPPGEGGDGGKCFIATAAYGSYLDSHVETLRSFRDQYLLTNPVGRSLVSTYYKLSPPLAEFIDDNPTLKPIVRTALLPAVGLSEVAVSTTSAEKIAIVGSLALVSVALAAWARKRRGKDSPCEQPHQ